MAIDKKLITTAFELPGYTIVESLGIVRGISVRSPGTVGGFVAGIESWFKGNVPTLTRLCEDTREASLRILVEHAQEMGANAIIGFRYDTNELLGNVTEVLAYGTAVIVRKQ